MVPVAGAAWLGMWLASAGRWPFLVAVGVLAVAGAVTAGVRRSSLIAAVALVLAASAVLGGVRQHALATGVVRELAEQRAVAVVEFTTTADPLTFTGGGPRGDQTSVRVEVTRVEGRGRADAGHYPVKLTASGESGVRLSQLVVGTTARATVRLRAPDPDADLAAIAGVPGEVRILSPPSAGLRLVERVRRGLRESLDHRAAEQRALVPALVLGDTSRMTDDLRTDFQTTGLTHLTAVSGANLTLLLAFLQVSARWLGVRGWWLRGVGAAGVIIFVALCRTEPSVLRAAAMGVVALAALGSGASGTRGLRHLSVAVLGLVLIDPWLSRSVGFALSVLASAGIIALASRWATTMSTWCPRPLAEAITVPLSAQLATQPLVTAISGQVSLVGLLANALAGPLVGPATVLGFATAGLALLNRTLAEMTGWGAAWCAQGIVWVAQVAARLPGASVRWPVSPASMAIMIIATAALVVLVGELLRRRWACVVAALYLVGLLLRAPAPPGWPPPNWLAVFCDVGQGDATVVRAAEKQAIVVDTGPDPKLINECLDVLGVQAIPLLVLTHFHADHTGGLTGAMQGRRVGQLLVPGYAGEPMVAAAVTAQARGHGVPVVEARPPLTLAIGEARWTTLGPASLPAHAASEPTSSKGESSADNDASIVSVVETGGVRLMLTGDVEPTGQQAIVRSGADLKADVLKLPHHGSSRQDDTFITDTHATTAIASVGKDNDYGHPAPKTVRLVRDKGMNLLRTDEHGAIALGRTPGGGVRLTVQR